MNIQRSMQSRHSRSNRAASNQEFWEMWIFAIAFVAIFVLVAQSAKAESTSPSLNSSALATKQELKVEKQTIERSLTLVVNTASSINRDAPENFTGSYVAKSGTTYKPLKLTGALEFGYEREYSRQRDDGSDGDISDVKYSVSHSLVEPNNYVSLVVYGLSGSIGASRESARRTYFGSVGPFVNLVKSVGRFDLSQGIKYGYRSYRYDIRDNGVVNSPDALSTTTGLGFNFDDQTSIGASFAYTTVRSFQGVYRNSAQTVFALTHMVPKWNMGFELGLDTVQASTLDAEGKTQTFRVIDADETSAYVEVSWKI